MKMLISSIDSNKHISLDVQPGLSIFDDAGCGIVYFIQSKQGMMMSVKNIPAVPEYDRSSNILRLK